MSPRGLPLRPPAPAPAEAATLRVGPGEPNSPPASSPKSPPPAPPALAGAVEKRELAAKALQHHFGRVAVLARLVLPFARLQRALEVNLRALFQILLGDAAEIFIEDDDAVPFGFFLALAGRLVAPRVRRRQAQIRHRPPILGATDFGIGAEIADQNHLVHASRHNSLRSFPCRPVASNLVPHLPPARAIDPRSALSTRVLEPRRAAGRSTYVLSLFSPKMQ